MTSLPSSSAGIVAAWIGSGSLNPISCKLRIISRLMGNSSKLFILSFHFLTQTASENRTAKLPRLRVNRVLVSLCSPTVVSAHGYRLTQPMVYYHLNVG